jgi:predicted CoA-binding protein
MTTINEAAQEFLAQKRIAVAGVSRTPAGHGANPVYRRLRERGYNVFAVNPNADTVEGDPCYRDLRSIPGGVDAVVIGTTPAMAESVVRDCHELCITRVWMHRGFGEGSVSEAAADFCRRNGMSVIAGGCPLMFEPTSDFSHRAMCWYLNLRGAIPKEV